MSGRTLAEFKFYPLEEFKWAVGGQLIGQY